MTEPLIDDITESRIIRLEKILTASNEMYCAVVKSKGLELNYDARLSKDSESILFPFLESTEKILQAYNELNPDGPTFDPVAFIIGGIHNMNDRATKSPQELKPGEPAYEKFLNAQFKLGLADKSFRGKKYDLEACQKTFNDVSQNVSNVIQILRDEGKIRKQITYVDDTSLTSSEKDQEVPDWKILNDLNRLNKSIQKLPGIVIWKLRKPADDKTQEEVRDVDDKTKKQLDVLSKYIKTQITGTSQNAVKLVVGGLKKMIDDRQPQHSGAYPTDESKSDDEKVISAMDDTVKTVLENIIKDSKLDDKSVEYQNGCKALYVKEESNILNIVNSSLRKTS